MGRDDSERGTHSDDMICLVDSFREDFTRLAVYLPRERATYVRKKERKAACNRLLTLSTALFASSTIDIRRVEAARATVREEWLIKRVRVSMMRWDEV